MKRIKYTAKICRSYVFPLWLLRCALTLYFWAIVHVKKRWTFAAVDYCLLKNCASFFSCEFETYEAAQNNSKTYKSEKLDLSLSVCLSRVILKDI